MELEGELSTRAAQSVRAHLVACWRCRARRQELERSIAGFIEAYQQEFDGQLPPGAGPRAMLKAELAQISGSTPSTRRTQLTNSHKMLWAAALSLFGLLVIGWFAARFGSQSHEPNERMAFSMSFRTLWS